jgi:hypothetical protein
MMFERIQQYPLMSHTGRVFRPRAYAEAQSDGRWAGWLVFFPVNGGTAIAADRETTQSNFGALVHWAENVSTVYLEGALDRAVKLAEQPRIVAHLAASEQELLDEADRLDTAADLERINADIDEETADRAREDARDAHQERLIAERATEPDRR